MSFTCSLLWFVIGVFVGNLSPGSCEGLLLLLDTAEFLESTGSIVVSKGLM